MKQKVRTRRRGPKQPIPMTKFMNNSGSYYSALENDIYTTNDDIDPWDLENYDYVRKKLSSSSVGESSTPSPAGEPISSTFFYLPNNNNNNDDCPACYAGMDEQTFYNTKYDMIFDDEPEFNMYTDFESPYSTERNHSSCEDENTITTSSLKLHTSGFRIPTSGNRKMVLPKPIPHLEFPSPPPYDYCLPPYCELNNYNPNIDCYECMSQLYGQTTMTTSLDQSIYNYYDGTTNTSTYGRSGGGGSGGATSLYSTYSNRFALSKKGLLQIDYSCNWNDLDRYIAKEF